MDPARQVLGRSVRMGLLYVVLSVVMGVALTAVINIAPRLANVPVNGGGAADIGAALGLMVVPFAAIVGLMVTTPVYTLFVSDKNAGVLEYLLAVGMGQRDIFMGYLKAALLLSLVPMVPVVLLNLAISASGSMVSLEASGLALVTGLADVAFVTVLMTGFSSMQRKPTGMNSPIGISVGILIVFPELALFAALGTEVIWLDVAVALLIFGASFLLLLSLDRLIKREKLLP